MVDQGDLPELSIDSREGTLSGPAGTVRLEPKIMGVFTLLAQHPGKVVAREEILREVWPDVVVTEHTLSRCIYRMRQAMKEVSDAGEAENQATIETLPKRGYRLLANVRTGESKFSPGAPIDSRDGPGVESATAPPVADDRSIAVLPFVDMSAAGDQDYFGEGIAEELINGLTRLKGLRVIARTSSFRFKGTDHDIATIGQQLNVATVLEGSVRSSGNRLRLTVQLIDVSNNSHLWSERYDRELGDIFDIQDDVARRVVDALEIELGATMQGSLIDVGTTNLSAYHAYLLGMNEMRKFTIKGLRSAIGHFNRALAVDPDFAAAHGQTGICHLELMFLYGPNRREMRQLAMASLSAAKQLKWEHPLQAWIQIERLLEFTPYPDHRRIVREDSEKIRHPDPSWRHFEYLEMGMQLLSAGWLSSAMQYFHYYRQRMGHIAGNLLIPGFSSDLLPILFALGRYEDAISEASRLLQENPEAHLVRGDRAMLYSRTGQFDLADADLAVLSKVWPMSFPGFVCLHWKGEEEQARKYLAAMESSGRIPLFYSCYGAFLFEDLDRALELMEQCIDIGDLTLLFSAVHLRRYSSKAFIREIEQHPRYQAALNRMGLDDAWREELLELARGVSDITGIEVEPDQE